MFTINLLHRGRRRFSQRHVQLHRQAGKRAQPLQVRHIESQTPAKRCSVGRGPLDPSSPAAGRVGRFRFVQIGVEPAHPQLAVATKTPHLIHVAPHNARRLARVDDPLTRFGCDQHLVLEMPPLLEDVLGRSLRIGLRNARDWRLALLAIAVTFNAGGPSNGGY